jgi:hypothetical protein
MFFTKTPAVSVQLALSWKFASDEGECLRFREMFTESGSGIGGIKLVQLRNQHI